MEMLVDFPGGLKVDAHFSEFCVSTDQPVRDGGENSAPSPFMMFLASLATCAGYYVLAFCRQHNLSTEGIRLVQSMESDQATGKLVKVSIEIQVPPTFPEKYHDALVRSADQCKVKKTVEHPPVFEVNTRVVS
ncbi:MAG: osmotically inducible protein OsmC [Leptolinea sp.]|jgi:ribosomal protein S12 methylthiotransferase accessory factor|nr:osmotically inducible protein OsmC [Leptolinea sp.]